MLGKTPKNVFNTLKIVVPAPIISIGERWRGGKREREREGGKEGEGGREAGRGREGEGGREYKH